MKKVAEIVRLMSMPMSWAASRSCAVARMALPSLLRLMKSASSGDQDDGRHHDEHVLEREEHAADVCLVTRTVRKDVRDSDDGRRRATGT